MDRSHDDVIMPAPATAPYHEHVAVPDYLMRHYWWAYVHPKAPRVFDRVWLINLIMLGQYHRLRRAVLDEFSIDMGRVLQVACVYGNLTPKLATLAAKQDSELDVVDVLPVQLRTLKWKLPKRTPARLLRMDSTDLHLPEARYDAVLVFFLLHEQPEDVRAKTIAEALRVLRPGGKLVICDYAKPAWWNPLRYLMAPVLAVLEPFTRSLTKRPIAELLPSRLAVRRTTYLGGFYQMIVASRRLSAAR